MSFSKSAWTAIEPIYRSILEHPFNRELAEGTLAKEKFQFYMKQDSLYLVDFARALAIAASRATTPDDLVLLVDFSKGAIIAERGLHEFYFDFYGIRLDVEKAPGCFTYTHFLISSATNASYEESLAALLPCFGFIRRWVNTSTKTQRRVTPTRNGSTPIPEKSFRRWFKVLFT